jgi:hypothetical protein
MTNVCLRPYDGLLAHLTAGTALHLQAHHGLVQDYVHKAGPWQAQVLPMARLPATAVLRKYHNPLKA